MSPQFADSSATYGQAATPAATSRRRLLLLEDHADTARMLARVLKRLGYEVTHHGTVAEAVAEVRERPDAYHLVLSDIGLPDGRGTDLARVLPARLKQRSVAISGYGTDDDIAASLDAGFQKHLVKPVDLDLLQKILEDLCGDA